MYGISRSYTVEAGFSLGKAGNHLFHVEAENSEDALREAQAQLLEKFDFAIKKSS